MSNNPIDMALGLRPLDEALEDVQTDSPDVSAGIPAIGDITPTEVIVASLESDETFQDIEQARKNIQNIIEYGDESLKEMIELAKQSESPRAFEVASTLMKTLLDANKDFVDMSMKKKYQKEELMGPKEEAQSQTNITNNNLILSTTELLKMIKGE